MMQRVPSGWRECARAVFVLRVLLLGLLASGCFLDRGGIVTHRYEVAPSVVCAGETVHLSWEVFSAAGCAADSRPSVGSVRCSKVESIVSSDPAIRIGTTPNPGEMDVVVTRDSTFTATMVYCQPRGDTDICTAPYEESRSVTVIAGAGALPLTFDGTCDSWLPVNVSRLSACLQMETICAPPLGPGERITVRASDADGRAVGSPIVLSAASRCVSAASFRGAAQLSASRASLTASPSLDCKTDVVAELPDIRLTLNLVCSASAPGCTLQTGGGGGGATPRIVFSRPTASANVAITTSLCEPSPLLTSASESR